MFCVVHGHFVILSVQHFFLSPETTKFFSISLCGTLFLESLFARVGFHVHVSTRIVSPSQCYVAVSRARENNWDKPLLDVIIIDSLCHNCKILIHGHFEQKSSNSKAGHQGSFRWKAGRESCIIARFAVWLQMCRASDVLRPLVPFARLACAECCLLRTVPG